MSRASTVPKKTLSLRMATPRFAAAPNSPPRLSRDTLCPYVQISRPVVASNAVTRPGGSVTNMIPRRTIGVTSMVVGWPSNS